MRLEELKTDEIGKYREGCFGNIYMVPIDNPEHHPECLGEICYGCQCCQFARDHFIAAYCHPECKWYK